MLNTLRLSFLINYSWNKSLIWRWFVVISVSSGSSNSKYFISKWDIKHFRGHPLSKYAKFSEKLAFLTSWRYTRRYITWHIWHLNKGEWKRDTSITKTNVNFLWYILIYRSKNNIPKYDVFSFFNSDGYLKDIFLCKIFLISVERLRNLPAATKPFLFVFRIHLPSY